LKYQLGYWRWTCLFDIDILMSMKEIPLMDSNNMVDVHLLG